MEEIEKKTASDFNIGHLELDQAKQVKIDLTEILEDIDKIREKLQYIMDALVLSMQHPGLPYSAALEIVFEKANPSITPASKPLPVVKT